MCGSRASIISGPSAGIFLSEIQLYFMGCRRAPYIKEVSQHRFSRPVWRDFFCIYCNLDWYYYDCIAISIAILIRHSCAQPTFSPSPKRALFLLLSHLTRGSTYIYNTSPYGEFPQQSLEVISFAKPLHCLYSHYGIISFLHVRWSVRAVQDERCFLSGLDSWIIKSLIALNA